MNILMVGDVYGEPGRAAITKLLPRLRQEHAIDCCVVNVENAAGGFGVTPQIARQILAAGADVMTSGNHIWDKKEVVEYIVKENLLLRPANFPAGTPGVGHVTVKCGPHKVGVVNLMGRVFMLPIDCPFRKADELAAELRRETPIVLVDMHAEATSESLAMGWYLDGRVSAVVGTHRHVQTADERVLPGGTAYITDLGMTGPTDGVIGVDREIILQRFLTQMPMRFEPAKGPAALHAPPPASSPGCRCPRAWTRPSRWRPSIPRRTSTACTRRTSADCSRGKPAPCRARRPAAWRSSIITAPSSRAPRPSSSAARASSASRSPSCCSRATPP